MTEEYDPKKVQDTISCLENAKMLIPYYPYGFGEYAEYVQGLIDGIGWHIDHIIDQVKAAADCLENDVPENGVDHAPNNNNNKQDNIYSILQSSIR